VTSDHARVVRTGTVMALASAAAFGSSGPMAKALLEAGWTAGAVVLVRLGGGAAILLVAAAVMLRGRAWPSRAAWRTTALYGLVAMAGCQLAFFNAVRTLDVGVALMIEYLAPVLLLAWTSARSRTLPPALTVGGAVVTLVGLALVLDVGNGAAIDPGGVAWALLAALGLAAYFVISEHSHDDLPALVMVAGGTTVGAVVIAVVGAVGLVPMSFSTASAAVAGQSVSWLVPALWLALMTTVLSYLTGIGAILRLGSRSASFLALTEVLFAVLVAWLVLAELPGVIQLLGGALIVGGIVVIRRQEGAVAPEPEPLPVPSAALLDPVPEAH